MMINPYYKTGGWTCRGSFLKDGWRCEKRVRLDKKLPARRDLRYQDAGYPGDHECIIRRSPTINISVCLKPAGCPNKNKKTWNMEMMNI